MRRTSWPRNLLRRLMGNPDLIKLYVIPGSLFLLDFVVRLVLGMSLIDAGADMALLAVATFISLLIENADPRQETNVLNALFIILSTVTWMISLRFASITDPMLFLSIDLRLVFSWFFGLAAFFFAGIMTNEIVQR